MTKGLALRLGGLLLLVFVLGAAAVWSSPSTQHTGYMWPVALASGILVLSPRWLTPYALVGVAAVSLLGFRVGGYPWQVSVGFGIGIAVEALVAQRVLTAGWTRRWRLSDVNDLGRYLLACVLSAVAGTLVFTATSAVTDFGSPWRVAVAVLITHAAGEAVILGLFQERRRPEDRVAFPERWLVWGLTLVATVLAFVPTDLPSLAFLVVPLLGWMAFRAPTREAMVQLVTVAVISSTLNSRGYGPFAEAHLMARLDPEFQHLPQQAFLIACALISIPFAMSVAMQRSSAGQALRERARSDHLVQSARGIAIIGTDELGRINLFSPGAEAILGFEVAEVYGQSTRMFHSPDELDRHARELGTDPTYVSVMTAAAALPPGTAREWRFIRKDGVPRTLSTILSPVHDDAGDFVGYVVTADDITDRIEAQAALEKALETERRAVRRLTEIDQVKDTFVSSVSHELRTPITNVIGYLELLTDGVYGELTADQTEVMVRITQNSTRLLTLIDDLLTLSSMEHVDRRRRRGQVDLVGVVGRSVEAVRPALDRRELDLVLDLPARPVEIVGDGGELERLVISLVTNSVKFTPDGGRILVRLGVGAHGRPLLEVEDTGVGIPAEDQPHVFTRFFRTAHAHELGVPGSGLGLSIAKAIAELHDADITADSTEGVGSAFRVEFGHRPAAVPDRA